MTPEEAAGLKIGDRVIIARGKFGGVGRTWKIGVTGTVHHLARQGYSSGHCGNNSPFDHDDNTSYVVEVRFDDFDYGPSPTNCHTACCHILDLEFSEPDEDEITTTLQSIAEAMRRPT
jgi:hypothetical protein